MYIAIAIAIAIAILAALLLIAITRKIFDDLEMHQNHIHYLHSIQRESPDYQARSCEADRKYWTRFSQRKP